MGEIKSTLDLVMEKTRHLTLSTEEKQKQDQFEAQKVFKGLLQRYQDELLSLEQLQEKIHRVQETSSMEVAWMRNLILDRIDPDQDNSIWLVLLEKYFGFDSSGLVTVLEEYRIELKNTEENWCRKLKETLATGHKIKGSAVVPNPEADSWWASERIGIQKNFQKMLTELKSSN